MTFALATQKLPQAAFALLLLAGTVSADEPCPIVLVETAHDAGLDFVHDPGRKGEKHLPETMGSGVAWLDFDGDGLLDLYAVQSGSFPPGGDPSDGSASARDRLWRNRGDGKFEDATERARLDVRGYGQGVTAADVNGDGWVDLYVVNFGPDTYLRNRADGTFEDATAATGLGLGGWGSAAAFADYDGDADLDLYVVRYVDYDAEDELFCGDLDRGEREYCDPSLFDGSRDAFLRQDDGRFVPASAAAGVASASGKGLGVVFVDLDGDLLPDLYVTNDITPNIVFHNLGDGTFEDVSFLSGAAANVEGMFEAGMGIAIGDVDTDGDPDVAVTNFDVETNTLYENLGDLQFEDVSARSGYGLPSFNLLGFGLVLVDFDRDGDLDVYAANGHIFEKPKRESVTYRQRNLLLAGDGAGRFVELRCAYLDEDPLLGRGLAAGDYDGDGDLDLALSNNDGPLQLWRNDTPGGGWVGLRLVGRAPNTEAVAATVELVEAGGRRQRRWVMAGDSYESSSDRRVFFGTGTSNPASIEVTWPSGERRRIVGPPAGRYVVVRE